MADPATPPPARRWRSAAFLAALGLGLMSFGGLVLPRMAATGVPPSLARVSQNDPVVVRGKRGHRCRHEARVEQSAPPVFISPADR